MQKGIKIYRSVFSIETDLIIKLLKKSFSIMTGKNTFLFENVKIISSYLSIAMREG
jgi:hypothetical protein